MNRVRETVRLLGFSALSGFHDTLGAVYTPQSWVVGLFLRFVTQVMFFAFLGRLLGSAEQVEFLLVGNAAMVAAASSTTVLVATVGERRSGTLPLIVASPSSPLLVLMGRGASFVPNGLIISAGAFLIALPLFDVDLALVRFPALVALLVLIAVSMYMAASFLGGLVLRAPATSRTVANVTRLTLMAFCGVSVPRDYFPAPIRTAAAFLPVTHGVDAIRELFNAGRAGVILRNAGLEAAVAALWLALALATFRRLAEAGRHDGSIVFSTA